MKSSFENTGVMKHHIVSGAAVSLLAAGTVNVMKVRKGETTPTKAIKEVVKRTTQGTIATASVVAASNYKGQKNGMFKALTALSIGAMGVYAVEMIDKKFNSDSQEEVFEDELACESIEKEVLNDEQ